MKLGCFAVIFALLACFPLRAASDFRSLSGMVVDNRGNPLPEAVVQIENVNTLEVRSYITDKTGAYHFGQLFTDVDFTLRARYHRFWSHPKTLSKFNSETHPQVTLVVPIE